MAEYRGRGRSRSRSRGRLPRALSSRGGGRGYGTTTANDDGRMAELVRQVVQQLQPAQPPTATASVPARRETYHEQMEAVRTRQREYDEKFWSPGEPWHYRSDRKELTYDLVGQVKMVMSKRQWETNIPPSTQDNLDRFVSGLQPMHRDSRLNDQLKSAANSFLGEIRTIMCDHLDRKLAENKIKILRYPDAIVPKAKQLATEKMAGEKCPPDIEAILRDATTERPSTPPGFASRLPTTSKSAADTDAYKRLRMDDEEAAEEGATGGGV